MSLPLMVKMAPNLGILKKNMEGMLNDPGNIGLQDQIAEKIFVEQLDHSLIRILR